MPGAIVAFSPWYDMEATEPTFDSNAVVDVAISRQLVHTFAPMFLGGQSPSRPLANPMYADPAGLPPLLLTCGADETLRDSVERFVALASWAGVEVALPIADGIPHVYQPCRDGPSTRNTEPEEWFRLVRVDSGRLRRSW